MTQNLPRLTPLIDELRSDQTIRLHVNGDSQGHVPGFATVGDGQWGQGNGRVLYCTVISVPLTFWG